jgi:hypothetical protein
MNKSLIMIALATLLGLALGFSINILKGSDIPEAWFTSGNAPDEYVFRIDNYNVFDGNKSAFLQSKPDAVVGELDFSTLMQTIPAKSYLGQRIQLTVFLKSELSEGNAGAWLRVDGLIEEQEKVISMDNMDNRRLIDNSDWSQYRLVLDVPVSATDINYGVLLSGKGKVWFDQLSLKTVGSNVATTNTWTYSTILDQPENLSFETY